MELALSVIFGLFVGQWLDEKFSGGGLITVIGFCFGLAAGARAVYRALQQANRDADREADEAQEERQDYLDGKDL